MSTILVGTSSWTDKTLIECGRFYPPTATTPEERLRFYASQFPIVEIDSSYYGIPSVENAQRWVERTPRGFVFNIKAYRLFTRHQTPIVSLGKEIAHALGPVSKKNVYDKDALSRPRDRKVRATTYLQPAPYDLARTSCQCAIAGGSNSKAFGTVMKLRVRFCAKSRRQCRALRQSGYMVAT
jgi:uncharacterized protein YecE (DUF72 family)